MGKKKSDELLDVWLKIKEERSNKDFSITSQEVKDLIGKGLIRKGLCSTSDILNKDYIKEVVYRNTEGYLSKNKKEDIEIESTDEELPDVESEKCSKPHISSLPYDLRSNDKDKLKERLNAIRREYNYLTDRYYDSIPQLKEMYDEGIKRDTEVLTEHYNFNNNLDETMDISNLNFNDLPKEFHDKLNTLQEDYKELKKLWDDNLSNEINNFLNDYTYNIDNSKLNNFDDKRMKLWRLCVELYENYGDKYNAGDGVSFYTNEYGNKSVKELFKLSRFDNIEQVKLIKNSISRRKDLIQEEKQI